jgi:hypothetical protein
MKHGTQETANINTVIHGLRNTFCPLINALIPITNLLYSQIIKYRELLILGGGGGGDRKSAQALYYRNITLQIKLP